MTDDRASLRLKLFDNGYTPLPNKRKMSLLKGWNTLDVSPEIIANWSARKAPERRFHDTGLRCGDIVALDFDVDDKDLLNKLLDELVDKAIVPDSPFVRIGRPPRELWVYRTKDKIGKRTTGKFAGADAPEDDEGFAVEVLGKGCQFAAFGQRDENTEYTWPVESLLDHAYMDLPEITQAQAIAVKDYAAAFFEREGLTRRSPGGGTDTGYSHVYDLDDDLLLDIKDMGEVTVAEVREALRANPEDVLRCSARTFRPSSGRLDSCMVSLIDGDVCVSDHGTYTTHFMAAADAQGAVAQLGQLLAARQKVKVAETVEKTKKEPTKFDLDLAKLPFDPKADLDTNLKTALDRYVYVEHENLICDVLNTRFTMTPDHFRTLMAKFYREEAGPMGGKKIARLADLWLQHPDRREVRSIAMRPDQPLPLYVEEESVHLNTYRIYEPPTNGDAQPGLDFLERLLPIAHERKFFMHWLAFKLINPQVRGPGIIMVAHDSYGTGRGTLFEIIFRMFAGGMVEKISFAMLAGKNYQSQYNEWLIDNLIVLVDEAQEAGGTVTKWQARSNAYEHLKEVVDPGRGRVQAVRKGRQNGPANTYASIIVATNHADSVVLPINDRRFFICENGAPQEPEYWEALQAWMDVPANIGAFIVALKEFGIVGYNPYAPPPMTASKLDMIDAGASELDRVMERAMGGFANTLLVKEQVLLRVEDMVAEMAIELPDDWPRIVERMFLRMTRKVVGIDDRVKLDGKVRTVRARGKPAEVLVQSVANMVVELEKNGPITRPIRSSATLIQFPERKPA